MKSCLFFYLSFILCSMQIDKNSYKFVSKLLQDKGSQQFKEDFGEAFLIDKGLGSIFEQKILKQVDKFLEKVDDAFAYFLIENLVGKKQSEETLKKELFSKDASHGIDSKIEVNFSKSTSLSGKKQALGSVILNGLLFYSSEGNDTTVNFDNFNVLLKKINDFEKGRSVFPLMVSFVAYFYYPSFLSEKTLDYVISIGKSFKLLREKNYVGNQGDRFVEGGKIIDSFSSELALNTKHIVEELVRLGIYDVYLTSCKINYK